MERFAMSHSLSPFRLCLPMGGSLERAVSVLAPVLLNRHHPATPETTRSGRPTRYRCIPSSDGIPAVVALLSAGSYLQKLVLRRVNVHNLMPRLNIFSRADSGHASQSQRYQIGATLRTNALFGGTLGQQPILRNRVVDSITKQLIFCFLLQAEIQPAGQG